MQQTITPVAEAYVVDQVYLFVETSTRLIHEVKFFGDNVLARPALPEAYTMIRKMPLSEFEEAFTEYLGAYDKVLDFVRGIPERTQLI